jgi:hypothetical protein
MENKTKTKSAARKGGTTFDVIDKLREAQQALVDRLGEIKDDPTLIVRCEALITMLHAQTSAARRMAPDVEQLKGLAKGLQLAVPMAQMHIEILKTELADLDDAEKLKFGRDIIARCVESLRDGWTKQKDETTRTMGKFDGVVEAALSIVRKVDESIANYERLKKEQKDLESSSPHDDDDGAETEAEPGGEVVALPVGENTSKVD